MPSSGSSAVAGAGCLTLDTVQLPDLQRDMDVLRADVQMPFGEPCPVVQRPYRQAALAITAVWLEGFCLHRPAAGGNAELGTSLDRHRLPTPADRRRNFLRLAITAMPANPLAPLGPRPGDPRMLREDAQEKLLATVHSARDRLVVTWLVDGAHRERPCPMAILGAS